MRKHTLWHSEQYGYEIVSHANGLGIEIIFGKDISCYLEGEEARSFLKLVDNATPATHDGDEMLALACISKFPKMQYWPRLHVSKRQQA